jgi:hypothetical protein
MTDSSDLLDTESLQAAYEKEAENIPTFSTKISELCKYIWAGSLAFFYATLSSGKDTVAYQFYQQNQRYIIGAAVCGSIALIADYVQNVCGFRHAELLVEWIENTRNITRKQLNAHTTTVYSKLNTFFFWLKNICCIAAALLTAYSILKFIGH